MRASPSWWPSMWWWMWPHCQSTSVSMFFLPTGSIFHFTCFFAFLDMVKVHSTIFCWLVQCTLCWKDCLEQKTEKWKIQMSKWNCKSTSPSIALMMPLLTHPFCNLNFSPFNLVFRRWVFQSVKAGRHLKEMPLSLLFLYYFCLHLLTDLLKDANCGTYLLHLHVNLMNAHCLLFFHCAHVFR